jgi:hypothetical protein
LGDFAFVRCLIVVIEAIAVVSDEVPLVVSRQLLQTFAQDLGKLESDAQKEVAHYALTQIQPRVVSFEEQVGHLSLLLRMLL